MAAYRVIRSVVGRGSSCHIFRQNNITRAISISACRKGLEEFFTPGTFDSDKPAEKDLEEVKTGRRWHASDLRQKSNADLHKLWYVLLKERNMLQTVKEEAKRLQIPMPSPERIKKVQKSMAMIKVVIGERERAINELEKLGYKAAIEETKNADIQVNANEANTEKSVNESTLNLKDNDFDRNRKENPTEQAKLSVT